MPDSPREILERILEIAPADNARLQAHLSALQTALEGDELQREESQKLLQEYQEAYEKLVAPANRIATFIKFLDNQLALIALGDSEFVTSVDPKIEVSELVTGTRVKVNEAYAVIGALEDAPNGPLQKVGEVREDGRLRLGGDTPNSQEGRLVGRGDHLKGAEIKAGDEVRLDPTGRFAIEHFGRKEVRDYFYEDVPVTPWESIGGQDEAIKLIRETIEMPLLHPELYRQYDKKPVKGILLYGPPGCGKTLIGKATAYNLTQEYSERTGKPVKEYFMYISGPKILNMWLGETERMVREIFQTAREKAREGRLVFIFMDEAESVLRTRSAGRYLNISNTVVPQFCAELDGLVSLDNVVLILTSNRPDYIDPAILRPERIDRKVKINRPDRAAATQILSIYLHDRLPLDPEVLAKYGGEVDCARKELVEAAIETLWQKDKSNEFLKVNLRNGSSEVLYRKDLLSGALLKSVVDRAKDYAIRRAIAHTERPTGITAADLAEAISTEYGENEIFPKTEVQDDWLKLLDYDADNVASVRPITKDRGAEFVRKSIV